MEVGRARRRAAQRERSFFSLSRRGTAKGVEEVEVVEVARSSLARPHSLAVSL